MDQALLDIDPAELRELLARCTPEELVELQRRFDLAVAMASPAAFAAKASNGAFDPSPAHVALIDRHLVELAEGRIRKLIITLPPRHGKSWLCSKFLPAWFLARWPNRKIILASYEASFAATWGGAARDVMNTCAPWTGVHVRSDSKARDQWRIAGAEGVMFTAGVRGPATGKGANLFVVDDPFKDAKEADSETIRQDVWNWYLAVASTRMETPPEWEQAGFPDQGAQLIIHTRWHEDDLIGRLEETQPSQWTVINLPALAESSDDALGREPGEALWPTKFNREALEHTRQNLISGEGIRWWWALYQQRPTSEEGDEFDMGSIGYYDVEMTGDGPTIVLRQEGKADRFLPLKRMYRFGTMDVAMSLKTRADWTVCSSWAASRDFPTDLCLLDVIRERVQSGGQVTVVERALAKHNLQFVGIEDKTYGTNLLQEAGRRRLSVRPIKVDTDKLTRAQEAAKVVRAKRLWLPRSALPWRDIVESEMVAFPNGRHDDFVDTLSSAAILVEARRMGKKPKDEPKTREEQVQDWLAKRMGKKRRRRIHPVLGRI